MSLEKHRRVILIAGPTASGKSALALRLAERLGGTIINADSMQVYRDLRVLTARPEAADEARVPHRLYGTIDGAVAFSVSRWLVDVGAAMMEAHSVGRVPIVVGGTGLYFKALTQGLSAMPRVPDAVRTEVRGWAQSHNPKALHAILASRDPITAAQLRPSDPQRIVRALEVFLATGRSLSSFHATRDPPLIGNGEGISISLTLDREVLRQKVGERLEAMMAEGAMEEVERLKARKLSPAVPVMRALGVPPLFRCLNGDISQTEAVAQTQQDTQRYLKRQDTFMRGQLAAFEPVSPDQAESFVLAQSV